MERFQRHLRRGQFIDSGDPIGVKRNPWRAEDILRDPTNLKMPEGDPSKIRAILYHDMVSEYDARLFSAYVYSLNLPLSPEFRSVEEVWSRDEQNHFNGFRIINQTVLRVTEEDITEVYARKSDFGLINHLLEDEFSILLVSAYDELCTVRGYSADIPIYDQFGPQFGQFIRRVIGDEGWHYSKFLAMIKRYHSHRLGEAEDLIQRIRDSEGIPYQNTFVMDHFEDVFTTDVFDKSAKILVAQLAG
ncbi:MAG: hypothetical protein A3F31_00205 [Candidatus Levybacteria bacterium RIFCSPHIGHO2_12_FULL_38_12]|nr:MAG: hypothetical protein A2770_02715 [Candidatus Levybacteria bacterium RIFCSPHIGHO2_01_FULL_38_12]OGH22890.1 MAG: hypothetical protein A3F31_00205 [Candidatus Levybacteria bacterium RIFCSPHIGHO2_12_FULL_38_12]